MSRLLFAGLLLPCLMTVSVNAQHFGHISHTESDANELWRHINSMCWEAHRNHKSDFEWIVTYREMRSMLDDAYHIRSLIHNDIHHHQHDIGHIQQDLRDLDRLLHHVQDDIRNWHMHGHFDHDHSFHYDPYPHDGNLNQRTHSVEGVLHHLMEIYNVKSQITQTAPRAPF